MSSPAKADIESNSISGLRDSAAELGIFLVRGTAGRVVYFPSAYFSIRRRVTGRRKIDPSSAGHRTPPQRLAD